jgi:Zn-dependent protease
MSIISQWLEDPVGYLLSLLPLIPAILPALILHEVAHGYTAYRLGDPTAKFMGRLSLNPLKHLDLWGTICMFVIGLGWAKPVPVDPRFFKNKRRDIFLVSIAGITANLIMFLLGCAMMYAFIFAAMNAVPADQWISQGLITETTATTTYYIPRADLIRYAYGMGENLIVPYLGRICGFVFEVVSRFTTINLCLAVFNLIPMPPLDVYRLVNTLLPNGSPFTSQKIAQACRLIMMLLVFTGVLGDGISFVVEHVLDGVGALVSAIAGY